MFAEQTEQKINEAVTLEIVNACKTYGADYHSLHEGYAVLLEEVEEAEKELDYIKNHLAMIWDAVKIDDENEVKGNARIISLDAVNLAKEACQIAAVAKKIMGEGNDA
jgi:hypothetical protein